MAHLIEAVQPHGVAYRRGIRAGDSIIAINGEPVLDEIDYQALTNNKSRLKILLQRADGKQETILIIKAKDTPLGLTIANTMVCRPRACRNKCIFCFIDQMPPGMRDTLYVKDDDWRLSLMMGNYITLTNVDDEEFERILKRKASPLYISVHATDMDTRVSMMKNPNARHLMERLYRLQKAGLRFHCQIVLCPGWNDGAVLRKTLTDLAALYPAAQSVALVPVGLTKYREGLADVKPFDQQSAKDVLDIAYHFQKDMLAKHGTRFVFPADELMLIAGKEIPDHQEYEEYPQIENGVGMLRKFSEEFLDANVELPFGEGKPRKVLIPCGVSVAPMMRKLIADLGPQNVDVTVLPIRNFFFGETITVTGLLTGQDILNQIRDVDADEILLCENTLRAEGDLFLDGMSLEKFKAALSPKKVTIVPNNGVKLYIALLGDL